MTDGALLHRAIRPGPLEAVGPWRVKTYTITAERPATGAGSSWDAAAHEVAAAVLSSQPPEDDGLSAGFVVLHHGEVGSWLLVDWWRGDILHQSLHLGTDPAQGFGPPPPYAMACSFELVVTDHERRAWARHVLSGRPDVAAYLADVVTVQAGQPYD